MKIFSTIVLLMAMSAQIKAQVPLNGKVLWLKAGGGYTVDSKKRVSTWKDASGNGYDAVQSVDSLKPVYVANALNGLPVVRFNGVNSSLTCPNKFPVGTKGYTIITVLQPHAFSGSYNTVVGGTYTRLFWFAGTDHPQAYHYPIFIDNSSLTPQPTTYSSTAIVINDTAKAAYLYQNGKLTATDVADTVPTSDSGMFIGSYSGYYWNFSGDIAEVLIYNHPLTILQMDSVNTYINHKFKINLPHDSNVVLKKFPQYFQMYQRNIHDSAEVPVAGYVIKTGFDTALLKLYRNDTLIGLKAMPLSYSSGKAPFSFKVGIQAREAEYKFELHLINKTLDTIVAMQYNIACGDVYIITGQSNTVVGDYQSLSFSNEYCRSYGNPAGISYYNGADTFWGYASGFNNDAYNVGGWGYRLQQYIHDSIHIPVAFIDGGVGGTSIEQNMKNPTNPTDLSTIYGRLLYRLKKSHLDSSAIGLFWYQGESNSDYGYYDNFKILYKDWRHDYPAVRKIYVVQIHIGCFAGSHWKLREIERNFKDSFKIIETMSVMGTPGHDGCHYNNIGYNNIGLKMWRLVNRDFYHGKDTVHITAPDVERAYYRNASGNSIGLLFKDRDTSLFWTADTSVASVVYNIKNAFYLDDSAGRITKVSKNGDTLILTLDSSRGYKHITYLPDHYYENTTNYWEGPWLMNGRRIGAFSFYGVPVQPYFKPTALYGFNNLCYGDSTMFTDSSTITSGKIISWKWEFGDGQTSNKKNPTHLYKKDTSYDVKLIVTAELNRSDSITKKVTLIPWPKAHFTYKVLSATRVEFIPDDTTGSNYNWDFGDGSYSNRIKKIYIYAATGKYVVTLTVHKNGCTHSYSDTVNVFSSSTKDINHAGPFLEIFPNPFEDVITIDLASLSTGRATIKIYDLEGKEILNATENVRDIWDNKVVICTKNLPTGMYILQIVDGNKVVTRRIIKMQ